MSSNHYYFNYTLNSSYVIEYIKQIMCLTIFCIEPQQNSQVDFILGFNRDEDTFRQALKFDKFAEDQNIYAGRDILSGGTWFGINIRTGLIVFLTNYDLPIHLKRIGKSRGKLVMKFLSTEFLPKQQKKQADILIKQQLKKITKEGKSYSPFNLTIYNIFTKKIFYMCSQWPENQVLQLQHSIPHGICNSDIKTIWPKTNHGLKIFQKIQAEISTLSPSQLFQRMKALFNNKQRFHQDLNEESSIFIEPYHNTESNLDRKTKCNLLMMIVEKQGKKEVVVREINYKNGTNEEQMQEFRFVLE